MTRHELVTVAVNHEHPLSRYYWWGRKAPISRFTDRSQIRGVTL
ncbi:MAG: hypothetical protein ACYDEY_03065 [Acidimicrobiales bacterium]